MKPFRSLFLRSIRTFAALGIALAASTGAANAAVVTFTVDESAVGGGSAPDVFQADGITGKYREQVTLNGDGTFSGNLIVDFGNYTLNAVGVGEQLTLTRRVAVPEDAGNADFYNMYAFVAVNGTFSAVPGPAAGQTQYSFLLDDATADVFLDPDRNTTKNIATLSTVANAGDDKQILTASLINSDPTVSFGNVIVANGNQVVTGSYALNFTNPTLVDPDGPLYWPSLVGMLFQATASGDVDPNSECAPNCSFPDLVRGDTSIAFQVPEPASLSLLGLGLLGTRFALRRRRQRQSN